MVDYDCKTNGHHWIDHPEDGLFCFYCDEKYDFVQLYNRIKKLEAALRGIIVHCEVPAPPNAEALKLFARIALEETK